MTRRVAAMLPQLFEDGIEQRGNRQGDKVRPSLLASPARFCCSVFLKSKRERRGSKRVHELGLGPPARPPALLAAWANEEAN